MADKVIRYSFYLLFFLVPLVLTPWNYELFEFNKMLVVYIFTAIITAAWLIKMVLQRKVVFRRSFWDLPLIIFFLSQVLSLMFSIDKHTSFWGYYSRFNGGLLSIICYLLLYWAFVSNMDKPKTLCSIFYVLCSAAIVVTYGVLEHLGIDAQYWVQDVRNRVFSSIGQPNWLAAWLVALMPIAWAFGLNSKSEIRNPKLKFTVYCLLFTVYYLCLLFTRSRSGLLGFGVAFFVFWGLVFWQNRRQIKKIFFSFLLFTIYCLLFTFIFGRDWIPVLDKIQIPKRSTPIESTTESTIESTTNQPLLISESGDIRKIVWKGAIEIWKHYPIFGTGTETFAYSYYWYRPREHNDVSEWDFLYNKAHNEYLNYLATTGLVGLVSYLILIGSFIIWVLKNPKSEILNSKQIPNSKIQKNKNSLNISISQYLNISFLAGFASIAVTNFFGFSVVPVQLLFFLFPAFSVATVGKPAFRVEKKLPITNYQLLITGLILLVTCYLLLVTTKYWYADTRFARAEKLNKAGQYDLAFNLLQSAIKIRSNEPVYHDELALTAASLTTLAQKENQSTLAGQLAMLAVNESDKAVQISPYNLNFWKTRTKVFYKLAEIEPRFNQKALEALLKATELAPTEPKIRYNLGLIYAALGQTDTAITTLKEAAELKPNYEDPHYALALFYQQKGEISKAREELELILSKINPASEKAKDQLEKLYP